MVTPTTQNLDPVIITYYLPKNHTKNGDILASKGNRGLSFSIFLRFLKQIVVTVIRLAQRSDLGDGCCQAPLIVYEPLSKLLVSPLITIIVVPYIFPHIIPPLRSLDYGSYGLLSKAYAVWRSGNPVGDDRTAQITLTSTCATLHHSFLQRIQDHQIGN